MHPLKTHKDADQARDCLCLSGFLFLSTYYFQIHAHLGLYMHGYIKMSHSIYMSSIQINTIDIYSLTMVKWLNAIWITAANAKIAKTILIHV